MQLQKILSKNVIEAFDKLFDVGVENIEFQPTKKEFEGDITIVIFPFVKLLKQNPKEYQSIAAACSSDVRADFAARGIATNNLELYQKTLAAGLIDSSFVDLSSVVCSHFVARLFV